MVYEPTLAQLAQAEEIRRKRRLEKKLGQEKQAKPSEPLFLSRPWIQLQSPGRIHNQTVRVMTWNLLAQCLVRSELFPTSGRARKASERAPMIHAEIISHDADILCMQEVDGMHKLLPVLDVAGYAHSYAHAANKPHGCLIAYKNAIFRSIHKITIEYDMLEVHGDSSASMQARVGSSRQTKNIANILVLQSLHPGSGVSGYVVATTHLFWHPAYAYERARQAGLLVREVVACRAHWGLFDWPCIIAGDFNFPPDDPAYSVLVGMPLTSEQQNQLQASRVVHVSIDPTTPKSSTKEVNGEGDEEDADPDRVIRDSREPKASDGLLSNSELSALPGHHLRSAYDEGQRTSLLAGNDVATYGDRGLFPVEKPGACEPMWTSFTHHWRSTLDYIFILDGARRKTHVTGYLQPHRTEDVERGLPQIGVCGSDHFSLCAELVTLPADSQ